MLLTLRPRARTCVWVCARARTCILEKRRTGMSGGREREDGEESKGLRRDYFSLFPARSVLQETKTSV